MYLVRLVDANGPNTIVWPPKKLHRGLSDEEFAEEIDHALEDYASLGRSLTAEEWKLRSEKALAYFGENSDSAFQRKKKDITIRFDCEPRKYVLSDGTSGLPIGEYQSLLGVANAVFDRLGKPTTVPDEAA